MQKILVLSNRPREQLLSQEFSASHPGVERVDPEAFLRDESEQEGENQLLLVDAESFEEGGVDRLRRVLDRWGKRPVIALIDPENPAILRTFIDADVTVFLRFPLEPETFQEARRALEHGRRFVDPDLSDSLVDFYLTRSSRESRD